MNNGVCAQCGTPLDVGLIFCKKCGATLRPPAALVPSPTQDTTPPNTFSAKVVFIIFLGCAVGDFIWGYIQERSVPAGVISVVGGLFGTAWYLLLWKMAVEMVVA